MWNRGPKTPLVRTLQVAASPFPQASPWLGLLTSQPFHHWDKSVTSLNLSCPGLRVGGGPGLRPPPSGKHRTLGSAKLQPRLDLVFRGLVQRQAVWLRGPGESLSLWCQRDCSDWMVPSARAAVRNTQRSEHRRASTPSSGPVRQGRGCWGGTGPGETYLLPSIGDPHTPPPSASRRPCPGLG